MAAFLRKWTPLVCTVIATTLYLLVAGIAQQIIPERG